MKISISQIRNTSESHTDTLDKAEDRITGCGWLVGDSSLQY
jgi:hypothetical protein